MIGKTGKNISQDQAMSYVFGYTVLNDVTARDIQQRHGNQYYLGKSSRWLVPHRPVDRDCR